MTARQHAHAIFAAALDAVRPADCVARALADPSIRNAVDLARRIVVIGGGKAGAGMVEGLETALSHRIGDVTGIVNVPDDLVRPTRTVRLHPARPLGINEPTMAAAAGVDAMLQLLATIGSDDVVIVLLSGGGSALLPAPVPQITLDDKIVVTRLLSAGGATIQEMNCVRKHLSRIKGGLLAELARGASAVWSLIISDVVGDELDAIASGPTAADPTTFDQALDIVQRLQLTDRLPANVREYLAGGLRGEYPETPKHLSSHIHNRIVAANADALRAAQSKARTLGYEVENFGAVTGDVGDLARQVAELIKQRTNRSLRQCLLFGGEITVTLGDRPGLGGRNQEFVLAVGCELGFEQLRGVTIFSVGTDGEDGPTDAAGAIIDQDIWNTAQSKLLSPPQFLNDHNAYPFFRDSGGLIKTGLTGTNVTDVRIVLLSATTS